MCIHLHLSCMSERLLKRSSIPSSPLYNRKTLVGIGWISFFQITDFIRNSTGRSLNLLEMVELFQQIFNDVSVLSYTLISDQMKFYKLRQISDKTSSMMQVGYWNRHNDENCGYTLIQLPIDQMKFCKVNTVYSRGKFTLFYKDNSHFFTRNEQSKVGEQLIYA